MKKIIIVSVAIVVLVVASLGYFLVSRENNDPGKISTAENKPRTSKINYDPPTEPEKAAGDQQKEAIVKEGETSRAPATTANVVLIDANQYDQTIEVRGFVSNVIKDGTCTAILANGQSKVTKSVSAFKDATTTQCSPINIPRSEFARAGSWELILGYETEGVSGQSTSTKVEVK